MHRCAHERSVRVGINCVHFRASLEQRLETPNTIFRVYGAAASVPALLTDTRQSRAARNGPSIDIGAGIHQELEANLPAF
jgi:hypothetical protein